MKYSGTTNVVQPNLYSQTSTADMRRLLCLHLPTEQYVQGPPDAGPSRTASPEACRSACRRRRRRGSRLSARRDVVAVRTVLSLSRDSSLRCSLRDVSGCVLGLCCSGVVRYPFSLTSTKTRPGQPSRRASGGDLLGRPPGRLLLRHGLPRPAPPPGAEKNHEI